MISSKSTAGCTLRFAVLAAVFAFAPIASAQSIFVTPVDNTPRVVPAHQTGTLCFEALDAASPGRMMFITLDGMTGEVGGKPAIGNAGDPTCFEIPPVAGAGEWKECVPPQDKYLEIYQASIALDRLDNPPPETADFGDDEEAVAPGEIVVWKVERIVTEKQPKPRECEELGGEWTFTFNPGVLECAKLPMKVTLPGFASQVDIETDFESDTDGLRMEITGLKSGERLVMIREPDRRLRGEYRPAFAGGQDMSKMLDAGGEIRGKYSLVVTGDDTMEGQLDVEKARYQGDVCSIFWPFHLRRNS